MSETITSPPRPKNYGWIYFFVFITIASVGMAGFMIWYNLRLQLKPEQLAEAKQLWAEKGPKSYDMVYTKQLNADSRADKFEVKVRAGKVEEVRMNGQPLVKNPDEERDPRIHHSMDRLFVDIEKFMDIDQKPGAPKVFVTAIFEPEDGTLRRYIRRVSGTTQRIEMHIVLKAVEK